MKKTILSTVALAAILGNSFAASDYYIDTDLSPTPTIFAGLEDLRIATFQTPENYNFDSSKVIEFINLSTDPFAPPVSLDATITDSFFIDGTGSDQNAPVLMGLKNSISGVSAVTISPEPGYWETPFIRPT